MAADAEVQDADPKVASAAVGQVLLVDSNDRSALAVVRSLGRQGVAVTIAEIGHQDVASTSRYAEKTITLPSALKDADACCQALQRHIESNDYALVMPMSDPACRIVNRVRPLLQDPTVIALPSFACLDYAFDKEKLLRLCAELEIPIPSTTVVRSLEDLDTLEASALSMPVVVKPATSADIVDNRTLSFSVRRVDTWRALENTVRELVTTVPLLIQEFIPGHGAGVYLLAKDGRVVSMVQQERIHEPPTGGGSSYRCTVPINPTLAKYARSIVAQTGWTGVAMLEFRGEGDRWVVMELNGRYWGSLALTIASGLDFPYWQYLQRQGVTPPTVAARLGCRQRHLGKDLKWLARQWLSAASRRASCTQAAQWMWDLRHLVKGKERFDVESWRDPLPSARYWTRSVGDLGRKVVRRGQRMNLVRRYHAEEEERVASVRALLKTKEPNILFVCKGNICRSPFAEGYARDKLGYHNVRSAGTYPWHNRMTPTEGIAAAEADHSLDLDGHRSVTVDSKLLAWADVIVVFDFEIYADISGEADNSIAPTVLLGSFAKQGEIADPFGGDVERYKGTYQEIAEALRALFSDG